MSSKLQVQNIPESFKSVHQYLASYLFPLLEETRAELSSSLKAIHRAPFAKLISVEERKSSGKLLLNVNVDTWRNTTNNSKKEPYRTLPGDIFLILDDKPENVMNLQCSTRTWAFAWVQNVTDNGCSTHLKLNVSKNISGEQGMSKEFFIVFLMNVTTNVRIWNCLHFSEDVKIIKHVLSKNSMVITFPELRCSPITSLASDWFGPSEHETFKQQKNWKLLKYLQLLWELFTFMCLLLGFFMSKLSLNTILGKTKLFQ